MKKQIIIGLLLVLVMVNVGSASIIDDINIAIDNGIKSVVNNLKTLALPGVGTVTITCGDGKLTCAYSGDYWHVTTNILTNEQILQMTLPEGTVWTDAQGTKATTGSSVVLKIIPDHAVIKKAVIPYSYSWKCLLGWKTCYPPANSAYQPAGASSEKEIYYTVKLTSQGVEYTKSQMYSYSNQGIVELTDNQGNKAVLSPSYVISSGHNIELAGIIYLDNGYGVYRPYLDSTFQAALNSYTNYPEDYLGFITEMKNRGLVEVTDIGQPVKNALGNEFTITYPGGSVGLKSEMLISKGMASTVTVQMNQGKPQIDKMDFSPTEWNAGVPNQIIGITVFVTNIGTSTDWFTCTLDSGIGSINYINNRVQIEAGKTNYCSIQLTPSGSSSLPITARVTSTLGTTSMTKTLERIAAPIGCGIFGTDVCKQRVQVTAYKLPEKVRISNAIIKLDHLQVSDNGYYEGDVVYGDHVFTSENVTVNGVLYYPPTPYSVNLQGGTTKVIDLDFSTTPAGSDTNDYSWLLWPALIVILVIILYATGLYKNILGFGSILIGNPMAVMGFLYLILAIILIIILWGIYNSIINFKIFG